MTHNDTVPVVLLGGEHGDAEISNIIHRAWVKQYKDCPLETQEVCSQPCEGVECYRLKCGVTPGKCGRSSDEDFYMHVLMEDEAQEMMRGCFYRPCKRCGKVRRRR